MDVFWVEGIRWILQPNCWIDQLCFTYSFLVSAWYLLIALEIQWMLTSMNTDGLGKWLHGMTNSPHHVGNSLSCNCFGGASKMHSSNNLIKSGDYHYFCPLAFGCRALGSPKSQLTVVNGLKCHHRKLDRLWRTIHIECHLEGLFVRAFWEFKKLSETILEKIIAIIIITFMAIHYNPQHYHVMAIHKCSLLWS